jgi:formylglycine-generating enzyme required for sulfatase activity
MVAMAGGAFRMGSLPSEIGHFATEAPLHDVTVPAFAIGKYEVTFAEWDACAAAGGCSRLFPSDRSWGRGRRPVIGVSWRDVQGYVRWLNEKTDGPDYRLPSEAEWEYAARAGAATRYAFGDRIDRTQALFRARQTDPVGTYAANAFGLFDMHGNAAEWVEDCYNPTYLGLPADGRAATTGTCAMRPYRGGAWRDDANALRAANRRRASAGLRDSTIGFRVARNLN